MNTAELFGDAAEPFADGGVLLRGYAEPVACCLVAGIRQVTAAAPLRQMQTPGGRRMSVAMTNCGWPGWIADRDGYRYVQRDPLSGKPWPDMPVVFQRVAREAAWRAGWPDFEPDVCLINRYQPGARLSLHQDRDEAELEWPIVSISLGLTATFLFGGTLRGDPVGRLRLQDGDVVVWGGPARLRYHGIAPLADGDSPRLGRCRINLTFRRAGVSQARHAGSRARP